MSDTEKTPWLKRLFWPDLRSASETDRQRAATRIARSHAEGVIAEDQLRERGELVSAARTRADLRAATKGLPGAASPGLLATRQVVTAIWVAISGIQFVVWALACIIGAHLVNPWWLWSLVGGLIIVGPLWWFADAEFRDNDKEALNGEGLSTP